MQACTSWHQYGVLHLQRFIHQNSRSVTFRPEAKRKKYIGGMAGGVENGKESEGTIEE